MITRFLILVCLLVSPASTYAETKVLTAEATYTMGDGESPSFAEAMVLQKAKQMALEQAGTYVESYTKVQNYQLTAEEIQTIAGGVLQVEVLEKTRTLVGDGLRFYVKIKATVTTDKVTELIQRIKGKNVAEEYKKLQEDYARLSKEIESWKKLIDKTPPGSEREEALEQIREREKAFVAVQKSEAAFFKRIVSGPELFAKAKSQLAEKIARKQEAKAKLTLLVPQVWEHGHIIKLGEPEIYADLSDPENAEIKVPVTVEGNEAVRLAVEEAENFLLDRDVEAMVQFRKGVEERLKDLKFVLEVALGNDVSYRCYVSSGSFVKILPTRLFITISEGRSSFIVTLKMPMEKVRQIRELQGKFVDAPSGDICSIRVGSSSHPIDEKNRVMPYWERERRLMPP